MFAETHWTNGLLYTVNKDGKKQFCMVGGLCHVFAKHELPEWMEAEDIQSFYIQDVDDYFVDTGIFEREKFNAIFDAEFELAKTIRPSLVADANPATVENIIVEWNDRDAKREFDARGDASFVLEVMDETIERVERENA